MSSQREINRIAALEVRVTELTARLEVLEREREARDRVLEARMKGKAA